MGKVLVAECVVPGCGKKPVARGLCSTCYSNKEKREKYGRAPTQGKNAPRKKGAKAKKAAKKKPAKKGDGSKTTLTMTFGDSSVGCVKVDTIKLIEHKEMAEEFAAAIGDLVDAKVAAGLYRLQGMAHSIREMAIATRADLRRAQEDLSELKSQAGSSSGA